MNMQKRSAGPIEEWTDSELIDQYRYLQAELADEDPETEDDPIEALVEELSRRGLMSLADEVEPDLDTAGREKD